MDLPIKFPNEADVFAADVRRFRALAPDEQVWWIEDMFRTYHFLAGQSADPDAVARIAEEDEARGRQAVMEFVARHT